MQRKSFLLVLAILALASTRRLAAQSSVSLAFPQTTSVPTPTGADFFRDSSQTIQVTATVSCGNAPCKVWLRVAQAAGVELDYAMTAGGVYAPVPFGTGIGQNASGLGVLLQTTGSGTTMVTFFLRYKLGWTTVPPNSPTRSIEVSLTT